MKTYRIFGFWWVESLAMPPETHNTSRSLLDGIGRLPRSFAGMVQIGEQDGILTGELVDENGISKIHGTVSKDKKTATIHQGLRS